MHEINLGKKNRFLKQFIYYILRFFAEKNKKKMQIAGFSFDSIFLRINIDGTYEKDEIDFLKKFLLDKLSSKICALDIGANIGNHTIRLFSKMFSEVYCFEPNPKIYALLKLNVEQLDNIKTYCIGLSNKAGIASIKIDPLNYGAATIVNADHNLQSTNNREYLRIELDTLDNILNNSNKKIDLIKLDVENHELNVLRGAKKTIEKYSPMILFETNINEGKNKNDLIQYLEDNKYNFFTLEENFKIGKSKFFKLCTMLLQDIFGKKIRVVKRNTFKPGYYNLIVAHKNIN